ncbi:helix-turn-helix domain-containing protein [Acetobacter sp. LMG 1636]|uniref:Helix-turn-helix domain-containing protein n=2 Tax=Acetobacter fallax TaxID=1737473 RepID=A0ABX0KDU2_9PROT|nr:helix-turn-helix domain-containing protein [Acetobacter fallax]NHO36909.1 helix-turn-helix domain-containing protein [Acetobacter fallax]
MIKDVCDDYGVGRTYCYKLLSEGCISAVKLGGKTLILAESIDKYFSALPAYQPGTRA